LQRAMRVYYRQFDHIFVLNTEQQDWLTGTSMRFDPVRIFKTAHWADEIFMNFEPGGSSSPSAESGSVVLFTGRLSREKGVFELPGIFRKAKDKIPGLRMRIVGHGPAEAELKTNFPEAEYIGWVEHDKLPEVYNSADLLILPSRFDTFSCVVLEAMSCGLPVIAYNTKGPRDIIRDSVNGFLVETSDEMSDRIIEYFSDKCLQTSFKKSALERADDYSADTILQRMLKDLDINTANQLHGTTVA